MNETIKKLEVKTTCEEDAHLETTHAVNPEDSGQKLVIAFKNPSDTPAYIDGIDITLHLEPIERLAGAKPDARLLSGGSCMGRTPILVSRINAHDRRESGTFYLFEDETAFHLVAFLSWRTFIPKISVTDRGIIRIKADGEGKLAPPGGEVHFETIYITSTPRWDHALRDFAQAIAREHDIASPPVADFKGWSTWDYYQQNFNDRDIDENLRQYQERFGQRQDNTIGKNLIQVDGGWWTERGDYLSVRADIEGGMEAVAKNANDAGFVAGIHLDGARAEPRAQVFKTHPDYFIKDKTGAPFIQRRGMGGNDYVFFDYSNPDTLAYMRNVLTTIKNEWGYRYFKIDFLRFGIKEFIVKKSPSTKLRYHQDGVTSAEQLRLGLALMKEVFNGPAGSPGDKAYFLGCSAVFGPCLGYVDGMRTGPDIFPHYESLKHCVHSNSGGFFFHRTVFNNDADYLVVRNQDEDDIERRGGKKSKKLGQLDFSKAKMWVEYAAICSTCRLTSDKLAILKDDKIRLLDYALSLPTATRFVPLDLWDRAKEANSPPRAIVATDDSTTFLLLYNWDETNPAEIALSSLPPRATLRDCFSGEVYYSDANGDFSLQQPPACSQLLRFETPVDFTALVSSPVSSKEYRSEQPE